MTKFIRSVIASLVATCLGGQMVQAEGLKRVMEFRDGTVLLVDVPDQSIPWKTIAKDGTITEKMIPFDQVESIALVLKPATQQVAFVRNLISNLGSGIYQDRENARDQLLTNGSRFRPILEQAAESEDPEVRWRLAEILNGLVDNVSSVGNDYDRLELSQVDESIDGDIGGWDPVLRYRGNDFHLNREHVLTIRKGDLYVDFGGEESIASIERIDTDTPDAFPPNVVRVDFDRAPGGGSVETGVDIKDLFADQGCTFESSFDDSFVAIQTYSMDSRTGKNSAANEEPTYQGTVTIRFCMPGNPSLPAGVKAVGLYVSYVKPNGTFLRAFDSRDQLLGEILTVSESTDFLGLRCNVPIAYVQVVPNEDEDPDFAFDDVTFDAPRPLFDAGDPAHYSVVLRNGERIQGKSIQRTSNDLEVIDLTIGLSQIRVPAHEVAVLIPQQSDEVIKDEQSPFVQLRDGSVVRGTFQPESDSMKTISGFELGNDGVIGFWGASTTVTQPTDVDWSQTKGVLITGDQQLTLDESTFGERWIEATELMERSDLQHSYSDSPPVWFQSPPQIHGSDGLLRTVDGEQFVLSGNGFQIESWSEANVVLRHGNQVSTLPMQRIRSIRFPSTL